ncbi:MAG: hypothetical protein BWY68_00257 [bacterium ADurb.Bin400]|nr:MAG: hypothetical protein BWY68_00257 [bacterium ADurb.Bin400]
MNTSTIKNLYAFVLGREQKFALEELKAVLSRHNFIFDINSLSGNIVFLNLPSANEASIASLTQQLAGTIKIFRITADRSGDLADQVYATVQQERPKISGKLNFGLSSYAQDVGIKLVRAVGIEVKSLIKQEQSVRFVSPQDGKELSSVVVLKNHLVNKGVEIGIFPQHVGVLVALNDPEAWSKRDYGKPAGDKYSGMVPPKLARMMVNIALGEVAADASRPSSPNCLVIDPFCGSGNILTEALLSGCSVLGSDISDKAVNNTKKNLDWLAQSYPDVQSLYRQVRRADATSANLTPMEPIPRGTTVVITEPYLGSPKKFNPSYIEAKKEYAMVRDLYLSFFRNARQLKAQSPVFLVIFPLVALRDGSAYSLYNQSVDEIRRLGYTQIREPLVYGREYQVVKRQIVLLALQNDF